MENRILEKANVAEQDYIRQGSQTILKMSSRNSTLNILKLILINYILPSSTKSFITEILHWVTTSSIESITEFTLSQNTPGSDKCPYFANLYSGLFEKL